MDLRFTGETMEEIVEQVIGFMAALKGVNLHGKDDEPDTLVEVPKDEPELAEIPVLVEETPKTPSAPPTLKDVREVLKTLRDRKGAAAVKELLAKFGANSVPELKETDYQNAMDDAKARV